jgi:hypothetical protein
VPSWNGITMPDTTPIPNESAKRRSQNCDKRRNTARRVKKYAPSSTAMYDASPTVKAGSRMCSAMTHANWILDNSRASNMAFTGNGERRHHSRSRKAYQRACNFVVKI